MTVSRELNRLIKTVENYLTREGLNVFHVELGDEVSEEYFYVGGDVGEDTNYEHEPDFVDTDEERAEAAEAQILALNEIKSAERATANDPSF